MAISLTDGKIHKTSRSGYWTTLIDRGIPYKNLISLLFYFMNRGQKFDAASAERELACKSTSFYFALLALPGSGAFKIFHPVLFKRALDTLKLASKLHLERYLVFGSGQSIEFQ